MNEQDIWEAIQNRDLDALGEMVKESLEEEEIPSLLKEQAE